MTRTSYASRGAPAVAVAGAVSLVLGAVTLVAGKEIAMASERDRPSRFELAYRAGKAASDDREARRSFQQGIDGARAVLAATPDAPDALLWLAANLAGEALTHGKLFALGVIPEIESTLLRLEEINPTYDHAAAARALASLYWRAPAVISVGSSRKAADYFGRALARAPDFPGNQAFAAAFFGDRGECGRAVPLARAVLARPDLDAFSPDAADWRDMARTALGDCE